MKREEHYYDSEALYERLSDGILRDAKPTVFLFGSAITAPQQTESAGVPGTDGILDLIRAEFENADQKAAFDEALSRATNRYQEAFQFLLGRRSQELANEIIKRAVWQARKPLNSQEHYRPSAATTNQICETLDSDLEGWFLNPAVASIGKLASYYPEYFGRQILTTNFDPLLEVSIEISGGRHFRTVLQSDGNLSQTTAPGCHVIHLHGYWHGSDTLHNGREFDPAKELSQRGINDTRIALRKRQVMTSVVCGKPLSSVHKQTGSHR
jgi:hypothetical protein